MFSFCPFFSRPYITQQLCYFLITEFPEQLPAVGRSDGRSSDLFVVSNDNSLPFIGLHIADSDTVCTVQLDVPQLPARFRIERHSDLHMRTIRHFPAENRHHNQVGWAIKYLRLISLLPYFFYRFSGALCGLVYIFTLPCILHIVSLRKQNNGKWPIGATIIHCMIIACGVLNLVAQFVVQ